MEDELTDEQWAMIQPLIPKQIGGFIAVFQRLILWHMPKHGSLAETFVFSPDELFWPRATRSNS